MEFLLLELFVRKITICCCSSHILRIDLVLIPASYRKMNRTELTLNKRMLVVETALDDGIAKYGPYRIFFGSPLIGERVGFEEVSERLCKIYFTNAVLGM